MLFLKKTRQIIVLSFWRTFWILEASDWLQSWVNQAEVSKIQKSSSIITTKVDLDSDSGKFKIWYDIIWCHSNKNSSNHIFAFLANFFEFSRLLIGWRLLRWVNQAEISKIKKVLSKITAKVDSDSDSAQFKIFDALANFFEFSRQKSDSLISRVFFKNCNL